MYCRGIVINFFPKPIKKRRLIEVINTRHQTIDIAGNCMRAPKTAVKPKKTVAICICRYAFRKLSIEHKNVNYCSFCCEIIVL
jgi:hypothetical protein